jgi:hypothetical protein
MDCRPVNPDTGIEMPAWIEELIRKKREAAGAKDAGSASPTDKT